ncbi:selenium cofactor biosynthesis protein YqeC [Maridesulfovibrio ferrireducens]|uniref:selenium cofactor biosynthesis protein YqeC n=1 Tax=Maridesulfovibrio ferrireducens TaxID=246191 RepID=UPI001A240102|nr:selenium cofactor biosynthesis protein YqeC [Maridesulfovibrio ferrireducens]MBI9109582.1 putative selenium-dependent hydroxylase accessory protein YqeC [Maridesulfovibrio ferrireducens]
MSNFMDLSGPNSLISDKHRLIALTGAGGKTTLVRWLSMFFKAEKKRVISTTTTKILPPPRGHIVLQSDGPHFAERIHSALNLFSSITVARDFDTASGKLLGLSREAISALYKSDTADIILVEADGAARKPLKAPAEHEPVIPVAVDLCIGVMGLDAVYRTLHEANVHRSEIFSKITGAEKGCGVTPNHLIALAESKNGLFKECPENCDKIAFLNKTDSPGGEELLSEFARLLPTRKTRSIKWFAGSARNGIIFPVLNNIQKPLATPEIRFAFSQ